MITVALLFLISYLVPRIIRADVRFRIVWSLFKEEGGFDDGRHAAVY